MDRLDPKAIDKIRGPGWDKLRPTFESVSSVLLSLSPTTTGELTTIYVKYSGPETNKKPYAVVWVKKASEIIVGFSLPEDISSPLFIETPKGCKYAGLTKFIVLKENDEIPDQLECWAQKAFEHAKGD